MKNELKGFERLVWLAGWFYILAGMGLLFFPNWFLEVVGRFPPFNRHYMGDVGSFALALGVGLVIASKDLWQHRLLIAVGVGASGVHALNHLYDALVGKADLTHWLTDTLPIMLLGVLFFRGWQNLQREQNRVS